MAFFSLHKLTIFNKFNTDLPNLESLVTSKKLFSVNLANIFSNLIFSIHK